MRTNLVQQDGSTYVRLEPTPRVDVKHGLKVVHHSYDYFADIKAGKELYKIRNPQSIQHVRITANHTRDSHLLTDDVKLAIAKRYQNGEQTSSIAADYNISGDTVRKYSKQFS